ncbi:hypothetical protein [Rhodopirellula bahusiensis]|uniref:hypothetical protein n=1 Tax=Rhodopirellula bahusiensis TaxID=2014065 RepID=UPI003264ED51
MIIRILLLVVAIGSTVPIASAGPTEDAAAYHLITVTAPNPTPYGVRLVQDIENHPRVQAISQHCKTFQWTSATPIYRERYAAALPPTTLPIVALVRSDGGVIWKASGPNVPTGDALADALVAWTYADRKTNPRAIPSANQSPIRTQSDRRFPGLLHRPLEGVIPDTITIEHDTSGLPWVPIGIAGFVGFAGVVLLCGLAIFGVLSVVFAIGVVIKLAS